MIVWPEFTLPPINLWSLGGNLAYQSRPFQFGMESGSISKSGQGGDKGTFRRLRSAHAQSKELWSTLKAHR